MLNSHLIKYISEKQFDMQKGVRNLVEVESGSYDKFGVDQIGNILADELKKIDFKVESVPQDNLGNIFIGRRLGMGKGRALILGHLDTVWPKGTLKEWPFTEIQGGLGTGPGVGDMKGGLIVAITALQALDACRLFNLESISFLLIPDEELGSTFSRPIIESEGGKANWAFVMEPARSDGGLVTSRGGVGAIYFQARGRTAHCGGNYSYGISAVRELARMVERIECLSNPEEESILNVGLFRGGEARQVVPGEAEIHIDLRAPNNEEANKLLAQLKEIAGNPVNPQVKVSLTGGLTRPAYHRTDGILSLYQRASAIAREMGIALPEVHSRAGSDANLIAGQGTPVLDGLGPVAWDVCTRRERISLASLGERAILLAHLLAGLKDK